MCYGAQRTVVGASIKNETSSGAQCTTSCIAPVLVTILLHRAVRFDAGLLSTPRACVTEERTESMQLEQVFFNSWGGLLRVAVVAVLAYVALVVLLRVSGKRTLSKMNAFDLVVTVALGSTLATIVLSQDVALAEGMLAFVVLIGMQFIVAALAVRSPLVNRLVKSEPRLLAYQGRLLLHALRAERVVEAEVLAAVRQQGLADLAAAEAVVLETDGSFTVVKRTTESEPGALTGVEGFRSDQAAREREVTA